MQSLEVEGPQKPTALSRTDHWWKSYRDFASFRYAVIRCISVPVPFLSHKIPIIGGRTFVELIVVLAIFALGIATAGGGGTTNVLFGLTILISMRFNVLTLIFGIPFERALFFHKVLASSGLIAMIIHALSEGTNGSGLALAFLLGGAMGAYLIKPYAFEIFYYSHILCYVISIPFAIGHGAGIFALATIAWVVDLLLRYLITQKQIDAEATALAGDVIRLKFKNGFHYEPGQYVFILIPKLHYIEYHPFSISSSSNESETTIHIRSLGDWTARLLKETTAHQKENEGAAMPLTIYCEGPFGAPMVNHESHDYEVFIMVSGGIGITPLQSLYNHFIHQSETGQRRFRKVIFVWSVKDKAMVEVMDADRAKASYLPTSFQPPTPRPPDHLVSNGVSSFSKTGANLDKKVIPKRDGDTLVSTADIEENRAEDSLQEIQNDGCADDAANEDGLDLHSERIFHAEYYLTSVRSEEQFAAAGIDPVNQKHLHFGRPSLPYLFQRTEELCRKEGIKKVAVLTCGPPGMINEVMDFCNKSQLCTSPDTVRFHGHAETFDF
mmetsp:Transcript_26197/g.44193  ORF Transcript_26197/g.44193 Transcript_26197/m.44193 type:complete len:553 (+) Transcript_26197:100-1758(+)